MPTLAFASCRQTARQTVADAEQPTDSTEALTSADTLRLVSRSGETTAIDEIDTTTGKMTFDSEAWYTLDGVRLSGKPSTKGIYINNGKKSRLSERNESSLTFPSVSELERSSRL